MKKALCVLMCLSVIATLSACREIEDDGSSYIEYIENIIEIDEDDPNYNDIINSQNSNNPNGQTGSNATSNQNSGGNQNKPGSNQNASGGNQNKPGSNQNKPGNTQKPTKPKKSEILKLAEKKFASTSEFKVVDKNGKVLLDNSHVKKVFILYSEKRTRYLEIQLTDKAISDLKKAVDGKDKLSLTLNGTVFVESVKKNDISNTGVIISGEYKYIMRIFNSITQERKTK